MRLSFTQDHAVLFLTLESAPFEDLKPWNIDRDECILQWFRWGRILWVDARHVFTGGQPQPRGAALPQAGLVLGTGRGRQTFPAGVHRNVGGLLRRGGEFECGNKCWLRILCYCSPFVGRVEFTLRMGWLKWSWLWIMWMRWGKVDFSESDSIWARNVNA
jgi:hypothetical protein